MKSFIQYLEAAQKQQEEDEAGAYYNQNFGVDQSAEGLEEELEELIKKGKSATNSPTIISLSNSIKKLKPILIKKLEEKINELEEKRLEQYKKFKELEMNKKDGTPAKLAQKAIEMEISQLNKKIQIIKTKQI